jgi:hypothetical protein
VKNSSEKKNLEERNYFKDQGADGRILKWLFKKQHGMMQTGFNRLRIWTNCGLL